MDAFSEYVQERLVDQCLIGLAPGKKGDLVGIWKWKIHLFQDLVGYIARGFDHSQCRHDFVFFQRDRPYPVTGSLEECLTVILHDVFADHGFERLFHKIVFEGGR